MKNKFDTATLSVCTDCVMFIANGDLPPEDDRDRDEAIIAGVEREQSDGGHLCLGEEHTAYFSWSRCECCNTSLGGDRYDIVLLTPVKVEAKIVDRLLVMGGAR